MSSGGGGRAIVLLSAATGVAVATIYLAQPLSASIAANFGSPQALGSTVAVAAQAGYAVGLLLLVPLGDVRERRQLATRLFAVLAVALAAGAAAPSLAALVAAAALAGAAAAVAHILVVFAATLAPDGSRGHVMGRVMGGLLVGILLARTASGVLSALGGWRLVFAVAAVGAAAIGVALRATLPPQRPPGKLGYRPLIASLFTVVKTEPELRRRTAYHALGMAGFGALWTALTLLLSGAPYRYGPATIGWFGLLGAVGVLAVGRIGKLADRRSDQALTGAFLCTIALGWCLLAGGAATVVALMIGIVLVDLGVQGANVVSQRIIQTIAPHARGRVAAAYMTGAFAGAAIGSTLGSVAFSALGWRGVCLVGAAATIAALALHARERHRAAGAPKPRAARAG